MNFTVHSDDMKYGLSMVIRALPVRTNKDELTGVLIESEQDMLALTCTDGEMSIRTRVNAQIGDEGTALLPAKLFTDLFRLQNAGEYHVSIESAENEACRRARIKGPGNSSTMVCMDADNYPDITDIQDHNIIRVPCNRFKDGTGHVLFALSNNMDETRRILTGVLIETEAEETRLVGLDGFKLSLQRIQAQNTLPEGKTKERLIVPGRVMNELSKILPDTEDELTIHYNKTSIQFSFGSVTLCSPLLIGEFIDYASIMPKEAATDLIISRSMLTSAAERCGVVASEGKNNLIRIKILSSGTLEMTANSDMADILEQIECEVHGNDLTIAFNVNYLIDILKNVPDDEMHMCFNSMISPCLIQPTEGDHYQFLLLPVRVFAK